MSADKVRPAHYTQGSKYEVINVIEHMGLSFSAGNALKYLARAGKKPGEDLGAELRKAVWYLEREIANGAIPGLDYVGVHASQWVEILGAWEIRTPSHRADALTAIFSLQFKLALRGVRNEIADLPSNLAGRAVVDVDALLSLRPGETSVALATHAICVDDSIKKLHRLIREFRQFPDYRNEIRHWALNAGRLRSCWRRFSDAVTAADMASAGEV